MHEPRTDGLSGMDGDDGASSIRMYQIVVAPLDPKHREASLLQGTQQFPPADARKPGHVKVRPVGRR